jgi:hypothetical protein
VALSGDDTNILSFTAPNVTSDETLTFMAYASDNIVEVNKVVTVVVKNKTDAVIAPTVEQKKESSSGGGSFGYLLMLIVGVRLFRK